MQFDGTAFVFGRISHHDAARIRPGLAAEIFQVFDVQSGFFHHFAADAFFQSLAGFKKSGYKPVECSPEIAGMYQQDAVFPFYQYDDGRRDARINLLSALRAALGDGGNLHGSHTAAGAVSAVSVPSQYL